MQHFEDLTLTQVNDFLSNSTNYEAYLKLDGSSIAAGFDGSGIFYTSYRNNKKYQIDEYEFHPASNYRKAVHGFLSKHTELLAEFMQAGVEYNFEVVHSLEPNVSSYPDFTAEITVILLAPANSSIPVGKIIPREGVVIKAASATIPVSNGLIEEQVLYSIELQVFSQTTKSINLSTGMKTQLDQFVSRVRTCGDQHVSTALLVNTPLNRRPPEIAQHNWPEFKTVAKDCRVELNQMLRQMKLEILRLLEQQNNMYRVNDNEGYVVQNQTCQFKIVDQAKFLAEKSAAWVTRDQIVKLKKMMFPLTAENVNDFLCRLDVLYREFSVLRNNSYQVNQSRTYADYDHLNHIAFSHAYHQANEVLNHGR